MEGFIIPVASVVISLVCNIIYHTVIFSNKFGKIEEKINNIEQFKSDIDYLDKRVNNFNLEVSNIKHTLDNLDKEVSTMRTETHLLLKDFRDEYRIGMKESKLDYKESMVAMNNSIERLADKIDNK